MRVEKHGQGNIILSSLEGRRDCLLIDYYMGNGANYNCLRYCIQSQVYVATSSIFKTLLVIQSTYTINCDLQRSPMHTTIGRLQLV